MLAEAPAMEEFEAPAVEEYVAPALTAYEVRRLANIAANDKELASLNISPLRQKKKPKKVAVSLEPVVPLVVRSQPVSACHMPMLTYMPATC